MKVTHFNPDFDHFILNHETILQEIDAKIYIESFIDFNPNSHEDSWQCIHYKIILDDTKECIHEQKAVYIAREHYEYEVKKSDLHKFTLKRNVNKIKDKKITPCKLIEIQKGEAQTEIVVKIP